MKILIFVTSFFVTFLFYGIYISQHDIEITTKSLPSQQLLTNSGNRLFYDYRGVINVRSDLSNGSSSPFEVINEAKLANLDFLFFTEINKSTTYEYLNSYFGDLMVVDAAEYNFLDARLLVLNDRSHLEQMNESERQLKLTDYLSQNYDKAKESLIILAHPYMPEASWTGPYPTGLDGVEILNPKAISQRSWLKSKLNVFFSLIIYPFNSKYAFLRLFSEPTQETVLWDQLNEQRPTWGFAGADASARAVPMPGALIKFPSYQRNFEIATNHVLLNSELTGQYQKDRERIIQALRSGQFYTSVDLLADPKGFVAYIKDKDDIIKMGSKIKYKKNLNLHVSLGNQPKYFFEIVLIKDGERVYTSNSMELDYDIKSKGNYRIQVRVSPTFPFPEGKRWITWIYSNPFFIK